MVCLWHLFVPLLLFAEAANRNKYRRCANSPFCKRYSEFVSDRETSETIPSWSLAKFDESSLDFTLKASCANCNPQLELHGRITIYHPGVARITLTDGDQRRYASTPSHAFLDLDSKVMSRNRISIQKADDDHIMLHWVNAHTQLAVQLIIYKSPWRVEYLVNGMVVTVINGGQMLNYEFYRTKETQQAFSDARVDATYLSSVADLWETWFDGLLDTTQAGPQAVGIDIRVPEVLTLHGMAEHALPWKLPMSDEYPNSLDKYEPIRFWNSDIPEFELNSPMALYATIPLLFSVHKTVPNGANVVSGLLWVNAAETFVNLTRNGDDVKSWWASETGIMDFFLFSALSIEDITLQYNTLTGAAPLQMQNTLGFHQCRWNYDSQDDLLDVARRHDDFGIPFDYLWLDIDHSDNRKYYTWNSRFAEPQQMLDTLAATKHNLVVIVDPHVKAEEGYLVHDELKKNDHFVKEANGDVFRGWCWPGDSRYPDFLDAAVQKAYHAFFHPGHWSGTAKSPVGPPLPNQALAKDLAAYHRVQIWNDMQEPSVFNKPEITLPRNVIHKDGTEHRAVHGLYSISFHKTTYESMRARDGDRRPFVLTRGAFIGSHRYGSIWTGDILTTWEHLHYTVPMLLHLASCGLSLAGADIGGFVGNPSPLLLERWFQLGVWYPFMRSHSTTGTRRREVYLAPKDTRARIRESILTRYRLIPFWYSTSLEYATSGRPMVSSVGDYNLRHHGVVNLQTLSEDKQFLVGDTFWIKPVLDRNIVAHSTVVPGSRSEIWFDFKTGILRAAGTSSLKIVPESVEAQDGLVWIRGGTVLFTKDRHRRSVDAQRYDPFTLNIYPNATRQAEGTVWIDNYMSDSVDHGCLIRVIFTTRDEGYEIRISSDDPSRIPRCSRAVGTEVERIRIHGLEPLRVESPKTFIARSGAGSITEVKVSPRLNLAASDAIAITLTKAAAQ